MYIHNVSDVFWSAASEISGQGKDDFGERSRWFLVLACLPATLPADTAAAGCELHAKPFFCYIYVTTCQRKNGTKLDKCYFSHILSLRNKAKTETFAYLCSRYGQPANGVPPHCAAEFIHF